MSSAKPLNAFELMESTSPNNINDTLSGYQNVSVFDKSTYQSPIIGILNGVIQALEMMLSISYPNLKNKEDYITARLVEDFLDNDSTRAILNLKTYRFVAEPASFDEQYQQIGYSDIRVITTHQVQGFDTTKADYIIECKRLDGTKDLNEKYITNGICRFIEEKYTRKSIHKISAMLGYVVASTDIRACVEAINQAGVKNNLANFTQPLTFFQIRPGFNFSYRSEHRTISESTAEIFHILFDLNNKL